MVEDARPDEAVAGANDMAYEYVYGGLYQAEDWTPVFAPDVSESMRRRVAESAPNARTGYLSRTPPGPLPYGVPARGRLAGLIHPITRGAARSLQGRYVTPALDLDEAGRVLVRRARAAAKVVNHCAARSNRVPDPTSHAALLEQWVWTIATRSAELAGHRARTMQSHYRGHPTPHAEIDTEAEVNALRGQVASVERYAAALRAHSGRRRRTDDQVSVPAALTEFISDVQPPS